MTKCLRCGYEWTPRVAQPKACPDCKRRDWFMEPLPPGETSSFGIWSVEVAPGGHIPTPYVETARSRKPLPIEVEFTFDKRLDMTLALAAVKEAGCTEPLIDGARYRVTFDSRGGDIVERVGEPPKNIGVDWRGANANEITDRVRKRRPS